MIERIPGWRAEAPEAENYQLISLPRRRWRAGTVAFIALVIALPVGAAAAALML